MSVNRTSGSLIFSISIGYMTEERGFDLLRRPRRRHLYTPEVDWALFQVVNGALRGHDGLQDVVQGWGTVSVPLFVVATFALWFLARPYGALRWKLATANALVAAAVAMLANQAIAHVWLRARPFTTHPDATVLLTARSPDPSFPSDHAAAAFAIAVAVLLVSRRVGAIFLAAATLIAISRVLLGVHYPGDVAAGALVGAAAALAVSRLTSRPVTAIVRLVSRVTDPLVAAISRRPPARA